MYIHTNTKMRASGTHNTKIRYIVRDYIGGLEPNDEFTDHECKSTEECAKICNVSRQTINTWLKTGGRHRNYEIILVNGRAIKDKHLKAIPIVCE